MKALASTLLLGTLLAAGPAMAAEQTTAAEPSVAPSKQSTSNTGQILAQLPASGLSVSDYYRQSVYDTHDNKIGDINDLIIDHTGKVNAAIIGVGGFLGVGEKDVAIPFEQLQVKDKNGDRYLVMEADKEALNSAPGLKFDRNSRKWVPENQRG
jgi:sporulation protein YlmC with PRC-barrel domain